MYNPGLKKKTLISMQVVVSIQCFVMKTKYLTFMTSWMNGFIIHNKTNMFVLLKILKPKNLERLA